MKLTFYYGTQTIDLLTHIGPATLSLYQDNVAYPYRIIILIFSVGAFKIKLPDTTADDNVLATVP